MGYKKAADGVAKKGKTRAMMPKMAGGGIAAAIKAHEKGSKVHRAGLKAGGMPMAPSKAIKMRGGGRCK